METQIGEHKPISVTEWILTSLILIVPVVNIVILFIFGFSKNIHPCKANWAKAQLLIFAIILILFVIIFIGFVGKMRPYLQQ